MKKVVLVLLILCISGLTTAQEGHDLEDSLRKKDSLLFHAAFKSCDREFLASLFTEDFEFYHDQSGLTEGRENFLRQSMRNCNPEDIRAKRILIDGSLEVHPLKENGKLYGALQHGVHRFEFINEAGEWQRGSIARFTHLWILEEGKWRLRRELSYDHKHSGDG